VDETYRRCFPQSRMNALFEEPLSRLFAILGVLLLLNTASAQANVFNMSGTRNTDGTWTGLASLEMVTVGNPGNAGDTRYLTPGYGAVEYAYQIGKYEVTAGQYTEFLNAVAKTDVYELCDTAMWSRGTGCKIERSGASGSYTYSVAPDRANRPVNWVSFWDAARFCNWLHNGQPTGEEGPGTTEDGAYVNISNRSMFARQLDAKWWIPSQDEWHKAAYHRNNGVTGDYFDYPTSSDLVPSNDRIDPDPGNNANFWQEGGTIGSPYYTTEVGEFENSESPYGTFDQGGNVREWNATIIEGSYYGVRGGYWNGIATLLYASDFNIALPTLEYYFVGFRVASIPEPGSLALLAGIAVMGLVGRRRWRRV
jgi:formylglycine-generating enzyme